MSLKILTSLCLLLASCINIEAQGNDQIWVNEFKYQEFVEIAYTSTVSINNFRVYFINPSDSSDDMFVQLPTGSTTPLGGGEINLMTVTVPSDKNFVRFEILFSTDSGLIYNGYATGVDFDLMPNLPPGSLSSGVGSQQLTGSGCSYYEFNDQWIFPNTPTNGAVNSGQSFPCATSGSGVGDPHFRTFDGMKYSFHGQCDLIMARTGSMGSLGLPLTIHARTTIQSWYSYISQAAVQIGSDTFEITANGQHYLNGQTNVDLPQLMAGQYQISKKEKTNVKAKKSTILSSGNLTRTFYKIQLDGRDHIEISRFKEMLYVKVNAALPNSEGMLGKQGTVGLIGRDGVTVMKDANAMGMEWQVRDYEPQLFVRDMNRAPQYPEQCELPTITGRQRRMLRSNEDYERAKIACDNIKDSELQEFCIEDILITGDFDLANAYSY